MTSRPIIKNWSNLILIIRTRVDWLPGNRNINKKKTNARLLAFKFCRYFFFLPLAAVLFFSQFFRFARALFSLVVSMCRYRNGWCCSLPFTSLFSPPNPQVLQDIWLWFLYWPHHHPANIKITRKIISFFSSPFLCLSLSHVLELTLLHCYPNLFHVLSVLAKRTLPR